MNTQDDLSLLLEQARALLHGERDPVANAANVSSLIYHSLPELNRAGFYWMKGGELVLGPFQGKPACVRIAVGKGVCGTAARDKRTVVVADVELDRHVQWTSLGDFKAEIPRHRPIVPAVIKNTANP